MKMRSPESILPIVCALARLSPEQRREAERRAKALRSRSIRSVVRDIRDALLSGLSDAAAAREIESAICRHRAVPDGSQAALRAQIRRQLLEDLGSLDDMPKAERIRQYLRE